jgi:hypothetical protein
MRLARSIGRSLPIVLSLLVATAGTAAAQGGGRALFEWRGEVDREVRITMRGRDIWTRDYGNNDYRSHRSRVESALPYEDGEVRVRLLDGRGDADVIQQPTVRNNYTTIVRVRDARGGADRYRLETFWHSAWNSDNSRNDRGRWDRGDRATRDDRDGNWDRGYDPAPDRNDNRRTTTGDNRRDVGIDTRDRRDTTSTSARVTPAPRVERRP